MIKDKNIYDLAKKIFPIHRSITGYGNLKTLLIIKKYLPNLKIKFFKSGAKVFDWKIPLEWNVKSAYILDQKGKKILDFKKNNLHLVSYSIPVNKKIDFKDLIKKIYSVSSIKDAIPYVTSYYKKDWGFCMSYNQKKKLNKETYKVVINSNFKKGKMHYGEVTFPGKLKKEIFFSTYICHPSLANNETSGPSVSTFLGKYISSIKNRKYTYRIIFIPETIGSIAYLSKNLNKMKQNIVAGFNITCVGDDRIYSYLPSKDGNTISDKIAKHILKWTQKNYKSYSWLERGSDERQYCSPGIDLPIASMMRSKFGEYPEYHTSHDDLVKVVSAKGLNGSFEMFKKVVDIMENNSYPKLKTLCEPHLAKYNLYSSVSHNLAKKFQLKDKKLNEQKILLNFLSYCDGKNDLLTIAEKCNVPIWNLYLLKEKLSNKKIIKL